MRTKVVILILPLFFISFCQVFAKKNQIGLAGGINSGKFIGYQGLFIPKADINYLQGFTGSLLLEFYLVRGIEIRLEPSLIQKRSRAEFTEDNSGHVKSDLTYRLVKSGRLSKDDIVLV